MNNSFGPDLTGILAAATEDIRRTVAAAVVPPVEISIPAMDHLAEAIAPLQPALERLDAMMPANWRGSRLDYSEMIALMQEGVPLAWVPPADVIQQLLTADDPASRARVIDDCRPTILASCEAALASVTDTRFIAQRALLEECVRMAEHGMFSGAQALAANVWDTLIRGLAFANPEWLKPNGQWQGYPKVLENIPAVEDDDPTIRQFREAAAFLPFPQALKTFWPPTPVPQNFNRHATAHAAATTQYTPVNAVTAVMLAVSVLRDIDDMDHPIKMHA
ncbi:hypothetical protein SANT12839_099510 [Streptomyces antimycoticus]|uniref:Uncharacterized protein n=1 Tax=Streptomyces antimycoticus TaxID=68175 RepID=A0A4D4KT89_9ACTN|nr:hypothetical protein [Streptomyces antimycoticus]GDY49069.1 hypothetical protein SANT12839_099510 [Streptomyces antimycoticus]